LNKNSSALAKSLAKVSSGMKINSAADDASGYAISERMRVQIRSLDQDNQNTQNGQSMMKVAEGAVSSTVEILKTLKEKVINAANDTNTDADRQTIQKELDQSVDQINDNAVITFNGKYLVDGSHNTSVKATKTSLTNESLQEGTTFETAFTELKDRNGNSLKIQESDTVTLSYVKQGKTYTTSVKADGNSLKTLVEKAKKDLEVGNTNSVIGKNVAGDTVYTADGKKGLTIMAAGTGLKNQIAGITISVKNSEGEIQKSVNAVLDNFSETIRAQDTSKDNAIVLQTGTKANQAIKVGLTDMRAEALGLQSSTGQTLNISTQEYANAAINVLDTAVQKALDQQTTIGSVESRLEYTSTNLTTASENVQSSESTIRDADMAKEMTNYTKNNVLLQAAQSMLAQANQNSSAVLSLLQ
jgi:flagellin